MQVVGVKVVDTENRLKWKTVIRCGNAWKGTSRKEKKKIRDHCTRWVLMQKRRCVRQGARQHTFCHDNRYACGVPRWVGRAQVRVNLDRCDSGAREKKQAVLCDEAPSACPVSEPQPLGTPPLPYNFLPKWLLQFKKFILQISWPRPIWESKKIKPAQSCFIKIVLPWSLSCLWFPHHHGTEAQ